MKEPTGPMGWGIPSEPAVKWIYQEEKERERLMKLVPKRMMRGPDKKPNKNLLNKVQGIQKENGIDSGFCFLFLCMALFGKRLAWLKQLIGSCVASGDMRTTTYRMFVESFLLNDPEELPGNQISGRKAFSFFAPFSYRAGRREAGIDGNSDGSLCMPHIKGKMKYGHLPCDTVGLSSDAYPEPQNTSTYKKWGASDSLMDGFEDIGRQFMLLKSDTIATANDAMVNMTELFAPFNICSLWAFKPDYQHSTWEIEGEKVWIYKRDTRERWAHNMSVIGIVDVGNDTFVFIENSWGPMHKGKEYFIIPFELFVDWLADAQCQSVGEIDMKDNPLIWPEQ